MKKPTIRPHSTVKTRTPSYFFGSGTAAAGNPRNKKRPTAKLPTSVEELHGKFELSPTVHDERLRGTSVSRPVIKGEGRKP